jgi:hypothetical protein
MVFEPTIPVFERAKTVHALGTATTVIGQKALRGQKTYALTIDKETKVSEGERKEQTI